MLLSNKTKLLLKQMGFSEPFVDGWLQEYLSIASAPTEQDFVGWIGVFYDRSKRVISMSWKPSAGAVNQLVEAGYWPELINLHITSFILHVCEAKAKPINFDSFFLKWVKNRIPPPQPAMKLNEWVPGAQLHQYCQAHGIARTRMERLTALYRAGVAGKGEEGHILDHDLAYRQFMARWE